MRGARCSSRSATLTTLSAVGGLIRPRLGRVVIGFFVVVISGSNTVERKAETTCSAGRILTLFHVQQQRRIGSPQPLQDDLLNSFTTPRIAQQFHLRSRAR
jgi:hypothetical protein